MIHTPTTFVIGAGASCVHGLPTGNQLLKRARDLTAQSEIFQLLLQTGVPLEHLDAFIAGIKRSAVRSIDSYLEKRQQRPATIEAGKAVIAALMGSAIYDASKQTHSGGEDWLDELIEQMHQGAPDWKAFSEHNSAVRFVTFNFDRIIEDRLGEIVTGLYERVTAQQVAKAFPVTHVHGQLPPVPSVPLISSQFNGFSGEWPRWVTTARAEIRVAHESVPSPVTQEAREAVRRSHILCFLGFAYDPANLDRLDLAGASSVLPPNAKKEREVYGSAFGLPPGRQSNVQTRFQGKVKLGKADEQCRDILLNYHVLRG